MENKMTRLEFVIGAFFSIVAVIMFINIFAASAYSRLSMYSASSFLVFGIIMMIASRSND